MTEDIRSELQPYLDNTESLLWAGKPEQGLMFNKIDLFMVPFGIVIISLPFFLFGNVLIQDIPLKQFILVLIMIVPGVLFAFGRFIIDAIARKNTYYGLSKNRILIKSGFIFKRVKSIDINTLSTIAFIEKNDMTGTILLGPMDEGVMLMLRGNMSWWPGVKRIPFLFFITNVKAVHNQINELQKLIVK